MRTLGIDIETFSDVDIKRSGLYRYTQSAAFQILLFAYAFDDEPVQIIDLAQGETLPPGVIGALQSPNVIKTAYNAAFEFESISRLVPLDLRQWQCTMAQGLYNGYPAGLERIAKALGMPEDKQKMAAGKALIRKFCQPCKPTKTNGGRTVNLPEHEPELWELFKEYCKQDVTVERAVRKSLRPMPPREQYLWQIDQQINRRGVRIDQKLVAGAQQIDAASTERLMSRAREITGLENPNSVAQLKQWLKQQTGQDVPSLNKNDIPALMEHTGNPQVAELLNLRRELGKTSVKKYDAMASGMCPDGRLRGLLQYYGANRTGRWAGRFVQVQNLPRNYLGTLDVARGLTKRQDYNGLKLIYGNVPDTMSQLIRTAFIPADGCYFAVADFSAIEARVISWLAGETWRLDVFKTHGKIYEASASQMFGVPIEKISKGNPEYALRQKGKVAELALGYQGSTGALITMGALKMGLTEDELPEIVRRWRAANSRIRDLWYAVESAAIRSLEQGMPEYLPHGVVIYPGGKALVIRLPSGRELFYPRPRLLPGKFDKLQINYLGVNQTSKHWGLIETYGGKLVENMVQAIARDCLAEAIIHLHENGYPTVMHVHDECIIELPENDPSRNLENAIAIMCRVPSWAAGLPLNADGFTCQYYRKD